MNKHKQLRSNAGLLGTIFSGLAIGLPVIPFAALAAPSPTINPCPRIYYEEPYNSTRLSPQGCPANTATRLLRDRGQIPQQPAAMRITPTQPTTGTRDNQAIATIAPRNGNVNLHR